MKKNKNMLTRAEKLSIKKYWIIKKFKIKPEDLNMEFLLNWYGKEYILDNVLYAIGKKKIKDGQDPYLDNVRKKINYLNTVLKVYGFSSMLDFDTTVQKDEQMENRMRKTKFHEHEEYEKLMMCFEKRMRRQKFRKTFSTNQFTKLAELILNDFAVGIKWTRNQKRGENNERFYTVKYKLVPMRQGLFTFIK